MKIFYFNDRATVAKVYISSFAYSPTFVDPARGHFFEYDIPEDCVPHVKVWETNTVLLSWIVDAKVDPKEVA